MMDIKQAISEASHESLVEDMNKSDKPIWTSKQAVIVLLREVRRLQYEQAKMEAVIKEARFHLLNWGAERTDTKLVDALAAFAQEESNG